MKALAGADPSAKPDYRSQALNELNKLEQKVILLNELLDNFDMARGEQFAQGDAYDVSWCNLELTPDPNASIVASCYHPHRRKA
jgi:hypothetical protein